MRIKNIEIEYYLDYLNRRIHLMDSGPRFSNQLINTICPDFQKELIETENMLTDVMDFKWILYSGNGLISIYKNYQVALILKNETWLHTPFLNCTKGVS